MKTSSKLPFENTFFDALKIYAKRVIVLIGVAIANIALFVSIKYFINDINDIVLLVIIVLLVYLLVTWINRYAFALHLALFYMRFRLQRDHQRSLRRSYRLLSPPSNLISPFIITIYISIFAIIVLLISLYFLEGFTDRVLVATSIFAAAIVGYLFTLSRPKVK